MADTILTVTINPAVDKIIKVDDLKLGRDHRVSDIHLSAGGKGINVSRALKSLRVHTLAIGCLGGTQGAFIRQALDKEKIPNRFLSIADETRVSLSLINESTGKITRILEEGPVISRAEFSAFKKLYDKALLSCRYVVLSGRNLPGAGDRFYYQLARTAKQSGKEVLLDTSGAALREGLKARPQIIKPNLEEARAILRRPLKTVSQLRGAVKYFQSLGIPEVIISLGADGAVGSDGQDIWQVPALNVKTLNTVGCGDAMIAGYLFAKLDGADFADALGWAVAAGCANSIGIRPGRFAPAKVRAFRKRVKIRQI